MVIQAAAEFRCVHLYLANSRESRFMFVCERCGHRAELLALHHGKATGPQVIPFPPLRPAPPATAGDRAWLEYRPA